MQNLQTEARLYNGVSSRVFIVNVILFDDHLLLETDEEIPLKILLNNIQIVHHDKNLLSLGYGISPRKIIEIRNAEFIKICFKYLPSKSFYHRIVNAGIKTHAAIAAVLISFLLLCYFFLLPFVAEHAVSIMPHSFDQKLGKEVFDQMKDGKHFNIDSNVSVLLNNYLQTLYPQQQWNFEVVVVKSNQVNAFALPDGHIIIYSKMLEEIKDNRQLAGLLAHEISHVEHRHSMRLLCKNIAGYLLISAAFSDVNGIMAVVLDNANKLQQLSFSRNYEKEADLSAFNLLKKQQFDPNGLTQLFEILKKEEGKIKVPEFIRTHPITTERIKYLKEKIKSDPYSYSSHAELDVLFGLIKESLPGEED